MDGCRSFVHINYQSNTPTIMFTSLFPIFSNICWLDSIRRSPSWKIKGIVIKIHMHTHTHTHTHIQRWNYKGLLGVKILIHPYLQQSPFHQPLPFHEKNLTPSFSGKFRNECFQLRGASLYLTLTLSAHVLFYIHIYISLYLYIYIYIWYI